MSDELIVSNLLKRYGNVVALNGISFTVAAGGIFGLLGKNGAGKTTAIESVIGLRDADSGDIHVCGLDARTQRKQIRRLIGVQLQSTALQDKITPREALELFASFYSEPAQIPALIERFGLSEKADAHFDTLSGGQRQRLALALAFVNQPRVLFLDEPTAGLDAQSRRELQEMIRQIRGEGRTVLLSTHDLDEAEALCDKIAIIDRGRIIAAGTPKELIAASGGLGRIEFRTTSPVDAELLSRLAAVRQVEACGQGWRVQSENVASTLAALAGELQSRANGLLDLQIKQASLEDVFIGLTGAPAKE